jgi:putative membrane protein
VSRVGLQTRVKPRTDLQGVRMSLPNDSDEQARRLVYLAAERTLTSWIRTAPSLMALGFVIDRFDLMVREMLNEPARSAMHVHRLWSWSGSILIGLGVLMAAVAGIYYLRYALRYRRDGSTEVGRSLIVGALFTFVLAAAGVILLVVLAATMHS